VPRLLPRSQLIQGVSATQHSLCRLLMPRIITSIRTLRLTFDATRIK
jgi:hypothetical protein